MAKHLRKPSNASTNAPKRFAVLWVAEVKQWRGESTQVFKLLHEAVRSLPQQPCLVAGEYEMDERSLLFRVVSEAPTPTMAKGWAIRGLREALLGVGIGLERSSGWAPLVLDLDPSPVGIGAVDSLRLTAGPAS